MGPGSICDFFLQNVPQNRGLWVTALKFGKIWGLWGTAMLKMGGGSLQPYIRVNSEMGVPPPLPRVVCLRYENEWNHSWSEMLNQR